MVTTIAADAPNVVWAIHFPICLHHRAIDGKAVKIASMIDEHTRESLLRLVDRSITGEQLVSELSRVFADRGMPTVFRLDNGLEMISAALQQLCASRVGMV